MKREILIGLISFTLIWLLALPASGQQDLKTHTVQRGETFSSIAAKYGMSESELRAVNPNAKTCFAGMKLNISSRAKAKSDKADNRAQIATTKTTTSAVTTPQVQGATVSYPNKFFLKGEEYFFKKKWSKAISSFSKVLSDPSSSEEEKQKSRGYLAKAQKEKEERSQRRREYWSNVADGLQRLGNSMQEAALKMENSSYSNNAQVTKNTSSAVYESNVLTNVNSRKIVPPNLDKEHMEEFLKNGRTSVIVSQNAYGKTVRNVEICPSCKGIPKPCPICGGRGMSPTSSITGIPCSFCQGMGSNCVLCKNLGYKEYVYEKDANGKTLSINGESIEMIEAKIEVRNDRNSEKQNVNKSIENSNYEQCPVCYGNKNCPSCAGRGEKRINGKMSDCSTCAGTGHCPNCLGKGESLRGRGVRYEVGGLKY